MFALRLTAAVIANVIIFGVPLFLLAGTFDWWRAWTIVGLGFIGSVYSVLTLPRDLLEERMKPAVQKGQPLVDRVLVPVLVLAFLGLLIVTPLDAFHFHLFGRPNVAVSSLGMLLFLAGYALAYLALRANAFAAPVIRHQDERHQTVVSSGVYAFVRHPMYTGGLLLTIGMPLWLGSYAGALSVLGILAVLVVRILVEERFLRRELPGYDDYVRRVRYRLVPFVW